MAKWWASISAFEHTFIIIAGIATLLLIIQIVMLLIGFAGDGDLDIGDGDAGISLFTVKGLTAFFAIGGWSGLVAYRASGKEWLGITIAFLAGCAAFFFVVFMFKQFNKLQSAGNLDFNNAIGKVAKVYFSIPANMSGKGKITLILQGKLTELDAMTMAGERIVTDTLVEILEFVDNSAIVKRYEK